VIIECFILKLGDAAPIFPSASDYAKVHKVADGLLAECITTTIAHHVHRSWVEMNHAALNKDPVSSYAPDNRKFLLDIAHIYDPDAVFQNLMPGGCKLNGGCGGIDTGQQGGHVISLTIKRCGHTSGRST
jgi:hypothetical protein